MCVCLLGILFAKRAKDKKSQSSRNLGAKCYSATYTSAAAANVATRDDQKWRAGRYSD